MKKRGKRYNPERRTFRGRSYKAHGQRVSELRAQGEKAEQETRMTKHLLVTADRDGNTQQLVLCDACLKTYLYKSALKPYEFVIEADEDVKCDAAHCEN